MPTPPPAARQDIGGADAGAATVPLTPDGQPFGFEGRAARAEFIEFVAKPRTGLAEVGAIEGWIGSL